MTFLGFIARNLMRRKLRTVLMLFAIFIAFLLFGVLMTFNAVLNNDDHAGDRRLIVLNKLSLTEPMPRAYVDRVRRVDGVAALSYGSWAVGTYRGPTNPVFLYAIDPDTYFGVMKDDFAVDPAALRKFAADRTGALVGADTAKKFGLRPGDELPIKITSVLRRDAAQAWTLHVDGIFRTPQHPGAAIAVDVHYDYLNAERLMRRNTVDMIWVQPEPQVAPDVLARRIDKVFANSPAETHTASLDEFAKAFIAQLGNIGLVIMLVVGAAFVTIVLIVANTMMMSFRERRREVAVLKAMGYSGASVAKLIFGEALMLSAIGGGLGLIAAYLASAALRASGDAFFRLMVFRPSILLFGLAAMALMALAGGIVPALAAGSLRPSATLARE